MEAGTVLASRAIREGITEEEVMNEEERDGVNTNSQFSLITIKYVVVARMVLLLSLFSEI